MLPALRHLCQGVSSISLPNMGPVRRYLSWENEQRCRGLLEASANQYRKEQEAASAAVLVSLCSVAGEPAILYTLRSSTLSGLHKGDVSFPGGKREASDRDIIATALRETQEELGVQLGEDCVWGIMRPLPDRVEAAFTLSISHLLQEENQGYTHYCYNGVYSYTLPVFPRGPHRVWGLTAIITELALELLAPGKYHKKTNVMGRY
ncbi:mitochondrial coenzyme A diphosphatase NUDT8 isoform X4 [Pogona vitticeps]|nr:nucleoside diphosphate-linked moiety X motif 8 isoform X3 [Pogona vitticeps]